MAQRLILSFLNVRKLAATLVAKHWLFRYIFLFTGFGLASVWFLRPIVLPPHDGIPGDYGDARLIITLLEHGYSYLFLNWPDAFWSPSWQFFPFANGLAMSETMAGNLPFFAMFRFFGLDAFSSYQAWFVLSCALNFFSAWILARELKGSTISSTIVAFLFTFAMPRYIQFNHSQLLPHFFSVFCLWGLVKFFKSTKSSKNYIFLAAIAASWQFWSSIYFGFFLVLTLLGLTFIGIIYQPTRVIIRGKIQREWVSVLLATGLAILILGPLFYRYSIIKSVTGYRDWYTVFAGMPDLKQLILPIPNSFLYHGLNQFMRTNHPVMGMEPYLFSGFIALLSPFLLAAVLIRSRVKGGSLTISDNQFLVFFCLSYFFLLLATIKSSPKEYSLYYYLYQYLPGFGAIRQLGRIHLLFLLFLGLSIQFLLHKLGSRRPILAQILGFAILVGVVLENIPTGYYAFSKSENIRRTEKLGSLVLDHVTKEGCQAFFLSTPDIDWVTNNDAMWISLMLKIPTFNGYSGHNPPGWRLYPSQNVEKSQIQEFLRHQGLNDWQDSKICIVKATSQDL